MATFRRIHALAFAGVAALFAACHDAGTAPSDRRSGGSTADTTVTIGSTTPTPPPPVVSEFAFDARVVAHTSRTDTMAVTPVTGAVVTLVEVAAVNGDTLDPSIVAATGITDANGAFRAEHVPAAYYRVDVAPPPESAYGSARAAFAPPRQSTIQLQIALPITP